MGAFFSSSKTEGVDIDLDAVQPTEGEVKMHDEVDEVLQKKSDIIELMQDYKGCQHQAQAAMGKVKGGKRSAPDDSSEKTAFDALLVNVKKIMSFSQYADEVATVFPRLLEFLSQDTEGKNVAGLDKQQALAIQLGLMLDFALKFDGLRMMKPELPNDFSYYRRLLPKYSGKHDGIEVKEDVASTMAMFTADPTPMSNVLIKTTLQVKENTPGVLLVLSTMANSCMQMLKQKKFNNPDTILFCTRIMTGAIVLFDHVDEIGAFAKKSIIDIKQCITILKNDFPDETTLLNSIRYSTKNFSDAPDSVHSLLDT